MAVILLLSCLHSQHATLMIPAGVEFTRVQEFPTACHVGLDPAGCSPATAPPKPPLMTAITTAIITDFAAQKISANHIISTNVAVRRQPFADAAPVRTALKPVWAAGLTEGDAGGVTLLGIFWVCPCLWWRSHTANTAATAMPSSPPLT